MYNALRGGGGGGKGGGGGGGGGGRDGNLVTVGLTSNRKHCNT